MRPSRRSSSSGRSATARASGSTRTPSGRLPNDDSDASKRPLTNTAVGHSACPKPYGASCSALTAPDASRNVGNAASAIGAVDV